MAIHMLFIYGQQTDKKFMCRFFLMFCNFSVSLPNPVQAQAGTHHTFSTYWRQELLNCLDKNSTSREVNATTQLLIETFPASNRICSVVTMPNESISHLHTP